MRKVTFLVVHHTASPKTTTVEQIRKWHKERGFSDIGYHAVIYGDGSLHRGRPEDKIGAHALGANTGSLGVSVCGNFETDALGDKQFRRLVRVLAYWCSKYGIGVKRIYGHRDVGTTKTACPGNNLYKALPAIRSDVQKLLNSGVFLGWASGSI
jgi:N-acetyl-anhydromuramyl-L-alanine amidase AmpD